LIDKMARHGVWHPLLVAGLKLRDKMAIISVDLDSVDKTGAMWTDPPQLRNWP
jgi:hypothetical protein